ncbi:hypothetical protein [Anaerotignum lactatifermentans]|uniref:hypothetical protein n=1 Tax=Anaerotignum lactatifermentans TaxID=160404 RepID=UPI0039F6124A
MVYVKNHVVGKWLLENENAGKVCEDIMQIMCSALEKIVNTARKNGVDENEAVQLASELFDGTKREFDFSKDKCDGCCKTCEEKKNCEVCKRKENEAEAGKGGADREKRR